MTTSSETAELQLRHNAEIDFARQSRKEYYQSWRQALTHRQKLIRGLIDKSRALRGSTGAMPDAELHMLVMTWAEHFEEIPDAQLIPAARTAAQRLKPGQSLDAIAIRAAYEEESLSVTQYLDASDYLEDRPGRVRGQL